MTRTAEMADVVLPGTASWCEADGTVTNSERRVQRVRKALDPPGEARDDTWILAELARRLGHDWGHPTAEEAWDELRSLSPMHRGMRYDRLEALDGHPVALPRRGAPRLAVPPCTPLGRPRRRAARAVQRRRGEAALRGARRRLSDQAHDRPPARVVQHRRAVEPLPLAAPSRRVARRLARGRRAPRARRGRGRAGVLAARLRRGAGPDRSRAPRGLAFMTFHFPDEVDVNQLTIDATDPKSGTAEFKAAAIRVEKLEPRRGGRLVLDGERRRDGAGRQPACRGAAARGRGRRARRP